MTTTTLGIACIGSLDVATFAQLDEFADNIFTINAKVTKDRANMFDETTVYHNVKNFEMTATNASDLCPTNDCTFKFIHEDSEGFTTNGVSDRSLDGVLKITSQGKTKIFNLNGDLFILEEENDPDGKVTKEVLEGTLRLSQGNDYYGGDEYDVNGTLTWNNANSGDLSLQGVS